MMPTPVILLKEGTDIPQLMSNISACQVIAEAVRTTLGPRGMDKLIVDGRGKATISNDGATILKLLGVVHPAAKTSVDIAKSQDGTTSVTLLAAELLKQVTPYVEEGLHPQIIIRAFRTATQLESQLVVGVAFKKTFSYAGFEMQPKKYKNPRIALLNVELELKAEKDNAEIRVHTVEDYQAIVDAEWNILYDKLEKIHQSGAKVILSKLPIGDVATQYFADRDMFCAGRVPEEETERSLHDAIMVVRRAIKDDSVVAGGGAIEMELSKYLRDYSRTIPGKQQLLIGAYAKALEIIPRQLCDNTGFDATNILNKLRARHAQGGMWYRGDINNENIADNFQAFVWEPAMVRINALTAASEAACLIVSVDETIKNPRSTVDPPAPTAGRGRGQPRFH